MSRKIAFIHALAGYVPASFHGTGWKSVSAAPADTTINNGKIFATVNTLLTTAPCRAPRVLTSANTQTRRVSMRKRGHGSFARGLGQIESPANQNSGETPKRGARIKIRSACLRELGCHLGETGHDDAHCGASDQDRDGAAFAKVASHRGGHSKDAA